MDVQKFIDKINNLAFYTDLVILVILLPLELLVLAKLKFKIDHSGLITLLLHLFVSIIRVVRSRFE